MAEHGLVDKRGDDVREIPGSQNFYQATGVRAYDRVLNSFFAREIFSLFPRNTLLFPRKSHPYLVYRSSSPLSICHAAVFVV